MTKIQEYLNKMIKESLTPKSDVLDLNSIVSMKRC